MYDSEMLKKLVRFEVDPIFFTEGHQEEEIFDLEKYVGSYKPTYQDLVVACENMIKAGVDWTSLVNWYCFVSDELADHYEGVWEAAPDRGYLWPNNDYDQFKAMDSVINWMEIYGDIYESVENISEGLQDVIQMAENYQYNKGLEPVEWRLTQAQRVEILEEFSEGTDGVSNSRKELFRRVVDEECAKENHLAMRIKGYGCYGGDRVFACDWKESRKWITKLFEKTGNPYYANTLGYIFYYGRCNDGIPDYEKAFQYFSVGAAQDVIESMYKLADMFLSGQGCIKSPETSTYIIFKLYHECRQKFCFGDDAKFADVAWRMAAYYQRKEQYESALYHYLEADYAIKKRLKKSDFFGDRKVQERITDSIKEVKSHMEPGYFKDEVVARHPYWLFDMLSDGYNTRVEISSIADNRYSIKLIRPKKEDVGKAFVISPQLERVALTCVFESEFVTDEPIVYKSLDKFNMYVDNIKYSDEAEYVFCNGDKEILVIKNADFVLLKDF